MGHHCVNDQGLINVFYYIGKKYVIHCTRTQLECTKWNKIFVYIYVFTIRDYYLLFYMNCVVSLFEEIKVVLNKTFLISL